MKIYAIIDAYDDGAWISEADPEHLLYSSLERAEENKLRMDSEELIAHAAREAKRYERWTRMNAARAILEANNFDGIQEAIPGQNGAFVHLEFKPRSQIIVLEVVD